MLRVSFHGLRNEMYLPSGESCGAAISGLPNSSSRSMMGGNPLETAFFCSAEASVVSSNTRHKKPVDNLFIGNFLSAERSNSSQPRLSSNCERKSLLLSSYTDQFGNSFPNARNSPEETYLYLF